MRPYLVALVLSAALVVGVRAGDLRNFDDAPLRAVQFIPEDDGVPREGWCVGDDGVIWHTINGGKDWERQPTGVRASLRSVQFLTPYIGWVAGREELAGGGSTGVLLYTRDGGVKWQRVTLNALPGLNRVRFLKDGKTGFIAGDCTDQHPSGVFMTADAGRTWQPVAGQRGTTWLGADFLDADTGALGGTWNRLALFRRDGVVLDEPDWLGGLAVTELRLSEKIGIAVGQGGVVLVNPEPRKRDWALADLKVPKEMLRGWDFHAVHLGDKHIWVAGKPGTVLLHSPNRGATWEVVRTKSPLPINGLFFLDEKNGWAVGELGSILATTDGGKTWEMQHRGGDRAAVLCVHARPNGVPLETIAQVGGEEGYLTIALRVTAADPGSAAPARACESLRFAAAVREAGGAAGESLWHFPLAEQRARVEKTELVKGWDARHDGAATEELLRQLVLALRVWRPEVVVTDASDGESPPVDGLVGEAVREAYRRAADPKAFPEQIEGLGLRQWQAKKLAARLEFRGKESILVDGNESATRLQTTPCDFAATAARLLSDAALPSQRAFALLDSRLDGAATGRELMSGVLLAPGGEARRRLDDVKELSVDLRRALETRRNLQALAEARGGLGDGNKIVSQIVPALTSLPDDQAAPAAFHLAEQFARSGQWMLSREIYLLMVDRYPAHPLTADACRWLIRHGSSSEAMRRQELGQFFVAELSGFRPSARNGVTNPEGTMPGADGEMPLKLPGGKRALPTTTEAPEPWSQRVGGSMRENTQERRRWYEQVLAFETRLTSFGPVFVNDPAVQFCTQSARRNLGDLETARKWYAQFASRQPAGPWRDAAQAELWLLRREGECPRPLIYCRPAETRPFLDGKLDDRCWQGIKPLVLSDAATRKKADRAETATTKAPSWTDNHGTEVYFTFDKEYLYIGLRCRQPKERYVAPAKVRPRDADLRAFDRVSILLDVDRDYATYYRLEIDQRGCVCEDCWGDKTWNPRWFVAIHSEPGVWEAEAAIPLGELSGDSISLGRTWACNIVRVTPGQGVQAFSLPADVLPRPEGMGLLMFAPEERRAAVEKTSAMPRAQ